MFLMPLLSALEFVGAFLGTLILEYPVQSLILFFFLAGLIVFRLMVRVLEGIRNA